MKACKPVAVSNGAFIFCRYSLAVLLWAALALHSKPLVIVTAIILALSALLTVRHAPMILLYSWTVNRLFPSRMEILDEHAMRFAHTFGAVLLVVALGLLYSPWQRAGWIYLLLVTLAKTVGALGFCAAGKMYTCMNNNNNGNCCRFWRKTRC